MQQALATLDSVCNELGQPIRVEGLITCLTFLSIEIDFINGEFQLPSKKLECLMCF